jgi:hypothetical protein
MIVQIDFPRAAFAPSENQSPLVIHPDRMPAIKFSTQLLKMIAWRQSQIGISGCIVEQL